MERMGTGRDQLAAEIAALDWYHTMELAPGLETPGWHDTRPIVDDLPLPASLAGKRCLDVGTFDGFWAFELERRGARGGARGRRPRPPAVGLAGGQHGGGDRSHRPPQGKGEGFEIAKRELGSNVERLERSVYDLDPEEIGRFDLVYLGSLLVHLRDPVRALEALRSVCDGTLIVVDGIDLELSLLQPRRPVATLDGRGRPWWWYPNQAGLARMVEAGGFELTSGPKRIYMPRGRRAGAGRRFGRSTCSRARAG